MVSLINELVAAGLIDRRTAREDRRAFALKVTPAGAAKVDDCLQRIRNHEAGLLSDLSHAERAMLIDLLERIEAHEG